MMAAERLTGGGGTSTAPALVATLTLEVAAQYIGMSASWLYKNKGRMPHLRMGRRVLFRQSDLDRWLDAQLVKPQ